MNNFFSCKRGIQSYYALSLVSFNVYFQVWIVAGPSLYRTGVLSGNTQFIQTMSPTFATRDSFFEAHRGYNVRQMEHGAGAQAFAKVFVANKRHVAVDIDTLAFEVSKRLQIGVN